MLTNFLTLALRSLWRYRGYTLIHVAGLSIGMAAGLLILLFIRDEFGYDAYHEGADQVYRVTQEVRSETGEAGVHGVLVDPPVAPLLKEAFPEVLYAARLTPVGPSLRRGDQYVSSGDCYWADPDLFDILSVPFVAGDPKTALVEPFSLVLSASKARALFGDAGALGQTVIVNDRDAWTVTGVFEDLPRNTHLPIDVLGSMTTMERWFGQLGWGSPNYATYIRLADGASAAALADKLPAFLERHLGQDAASSRLHLQPLRDIHLRSHLVGELGANGDIRGVYLFGAVGLFILVIASINFTNLSTARASRRAREVGVRKASGAGRPALMYQFLSESVLLALISLAVSIGMVGLAMPFFNAFTGKELAVFGNDSVGYIALYLGLALAVGIAAGSYPAFYLSGFKPIAALKGRLDRGGASGLRAALVTVQFVIAIVLLMSTQTVYRQLTFISEVDPGYRRENVLILPVLWDEMEQFEPIRNRLEAHPDIVAVAQSNPVPSERLSFTVEATVAPAMTTVYPVFVDARFFPAYGIDLVAGRNFSDELASESATGFILNESAVRRLGWASPQDAVGAPMKVGGWGGSVLGVVPDVHFESLHQAIAPMVYYMDPRNYRKVSVRMRAGADLPAVVALLEQEWQRYEPGQPLDYALLDDQMRAVYLPERRLGQLVAGFSVLAFFITGLGLFAMAVHTVERRTKEVGIRKALGASAGAIVLLLARENLRVALVACLIAAPIAMMLMQRWLDGFAYHADFSVWTLLTSAAITVAVAILTIGYQTLRAAQSDPVESLRYE
ncbi:MAG: ABC transporter permease [Rhodothermales bacterium]